jgi:hypothetical protein
MEICGAVISADLCHRVLDDRTRSVVPYPFGAAFQLMHGPAVAVPRMMRVFFLFRGTGRRFRGRPDNPVGFLWAFLHGLPCSLTRE